MEKKYSAKLISAGLVKEIKNAIKKVESYGSVELFIQKGVVTQITTRSIKKTKEMPENPHISK